jgi:hypothetical protein
MKRTGSSEMEVLKNWPNQEIMPELFTHPGWPEMPLSLI